jgi:hypothetical protein
MSRKNSDQKSTKDILTDLTEYNCHQPREAAASFHVDSLICSNILSISENENKSLQRDLDWDPYSAAMINPTTATIKEDNCRYG